MRVPTDATITLLTASTGGSYVYDLRGVDRASIQLHSTLTTAATDVITLKISNDGIHYVGFSTAKTVTLTGGTTDDALFELGPIDYAFLQINAASPSAGTVTLTGTLYATATTVQGV